MSFSKLFGSGKPDITVEPSFDAKPPLYHVYPSAIEPGSQAPKTTTLTGRLRVNLKKPETIVEMYTTLTPRWFVRNKRYKDEGSLPSYSCRIEPPDTELGAGSYDFPFIFTLPCTSWPRSFMLNEVAPASQAIEDISSFNIWYALELVIQRRQSDGRLSKFTAEFPNRRKGLLLEGTMEEWKTTYHNRFFALIASPADPGELPPPLEQVMEEFTPYTGPIVAILTARSFTPACLLTININLPDIPPTSVLRNIRIFIHQTFTWRSLNSGGPAFTEGPFVFPLLSLSGPFREQEQGQNGASVSKSVRLPDGRYLAPSTLKNTLTPNNISHQIVLEFVLMDERGQERAIKLNTPVTLSCCTLIHEWLSVPQYGASAPPIRSDFQPERPKDAYSCMCGFNIGQLLEREEEGILSHDQYEPPPTKPREEEDR